VGSGVKRSTERTWQIVN